MRRIHQMRETNFVPDHAKKGLFQFPAARATCLRDGVDIGGIHLSIADDADMLDGLEFLPGKAEQTALK